MSSLPQFRKDHFGSVGFGVVDKFHEFAESTVGEAVSFFDEPMEVFVGKGVELSIPEAPEGHAVYSQVGEVGFEFLLHCFGRIDFFSRVVTHQIDGSIWDRSIRRTER